VNVLIISVSGGKPSRSHTLASHAGKAVSAADPEGSVSWLDFAEDPLPHFEGPATWSHPKVTAAKERIAGADALIIAAPIYNYTLPSAAKSLIELTGEAWEDKIVGFLCAAGGSHSYMAPISFANCLMLDFRCLILPRFVYATGESFSPAGELTDGEIRSRIDRFAEDLLRLEGWKR
jgi:NAD(P)H-dependent FMN reductase